MKETYEGFMMRDGDDVSLMTLRKIGETIDWRKDRAWAEKDGVCETIKKHIELQNVLHNFEQI